MLSTPQFQIQTYDTVQAFPSIQSNSGSRVLRLVNEGHAGVQDKEFQSSKVSISNQKNTRRSNKLSHDFQHKYGREEQESGGSAVQGHETQKLVSHKDVNSALDICKQNLNDTISSYLTNCQ